MTTTNESGPTRCTTCYSEHHRHVESEPICPGGHRRATDAKEQPAPQGAIGSWQNGRWVVSPSWVGGGEVMANSIRPAT